MKRGTPHHPKTLALAALLDVDRCTAVGILEGLFHWAGGYARRGDVGKHSDAAIASGVGSSIEAVRLVGALKESGWLDECPCHRLRVHDWPEHADQAVHKTAEVKKSGFLPCYSGGSPEGLRKVSGVPPEVRTLQPAQGTGRKADGAGNREDGSHAAVVLEHQVQEYAHEVWMAFCKKAGHPETRQPSSNDNYTLKAWLDASIPLHVVLAAIRESNGSGYTLAYYRNQVDESYARWRKTVQVAG